MQHVRDTRSHVRHVCGSLHESPLTQSAVKQAPKAVSRPVINHAPPERLGCGPIPRVTCGCAAKLTTNSLLPIEELIQRFVLRTAKQDEGRPFFELVTGLERCRVAGKNDARPVFPIACAIGNTDAGMGSALGRPVFKHDEAVAITPVEVEERNPRRIGSNRFLLEQRLALLKGPDLLSAVGTGPGHMCKERVHGHFVVAQQGYG